MCLLSFISTLDAEFKCWRSYPDESKTQAWNKKELEESITNGKSNENTEILKKVNNVTTSENAVKVVKEFEQIIKNKKAT